MNGEMSPIGLREKPTELPKGEEVDFVPLGEVLADGDYLDDERSALHEPASRVARLAVSDVNLRELARERAPGSGPLQSAQPSR